MPKLIDYPRTSYTSAWEVAEVVDDTGGKCALETCARKLNRKVSGSFKAIIGSAVKFGLLTSKREMLTTTTLFRRIKHAYDKQEELLFHREAFLAPPLFTQLCRKFRSRELPVAMLDVLLIREFDVEEINAQSVAKAFVDGARMVGLLDDQNLLTDIDQITTRQQPRQEIASPMPANNAFRSQLTPQLSSTSHNTETEEEKIEKSAIIKEAEAPTVRVTGGRTSAGLPLPPPRATPSATEDAIANLFKLAPTAHTHAEASNSTNTPVIPAKSPASSNNTNLPSHQLPSRNHGDSGLLFQLQLKGPGINTSLDVTDAADLLLVRALLDKIERQLNRT